MDILSIPYSAMVIRTLVYYDIFNYPLSVEDIIEKCHFKEIDETQYISLLNQLVKDGILFYKDGFYSFQNKQELIAARVKGNEKALKWMKKAQRFSAFISKFPYVRGVALSGSLSKGYLGENPDIDYFIITHPDRLWLARTLLVLFKKVFLLNSYKYFCINYFISTEDLEIEEKNIFTATELTTMIPIFGNEVNNSLIRMNRWVRQYYPYFLEHDKEYLIDGDKSVIKTFIESLFSKGLGEKLDTYFMNYTNNHWRKKFKGKLSNEELDLVFKASKKISKHHPQNFQKYVLNEFQKRIDYLHSEFDIHVEFPKLNENQIAS